MDNGSLRKSIVAGNIALTPILGTLSALVGPRYDSSDSRMLNAIAADQLGWNASAMLGLLAAATSLIAVLGLVHMLRYRVPVLRCLGGVLAILGILGIPGVIATDLLKGQMAKQPNRAAMVGLASNYASPSGVHWFYRMLIAYGLGFIFLAVGLRRARLVPWWMSATFGVGAFAAFALDAVPGGHDGFGLGTLAGGIIFVAGSVALGRSVLRTSARDWEASPAIASATSGAPDSAVC